MTKPIQTIKQWTMDRYKQQVVTKETELAALLHRHIPAAAAAMQQPDTVHRLLFMEATDYDPHDPKEGKYAFEAKEPGYLLGMLEGYIHMLESLDEPMTPRLYQDLHDICCAYITPPIPKGFRTYADGGEAFQVILGETLSHAGYAELVRKITKEYTTTAEGDRVYPFLSALVDPRYTVDLSNTTPSFLKLRPVQPATCRFFVEYAIKRFHLAPKDTPREALYAAIRLAQDLDQFHVFVDGNIRTTGILVLNHTLLRLGFPITVLEDVNCLDAMSVAEIADRVQRGFLWKLE